MNEQLEEFITKLDSLLSPSDNSYQELADYLLGDSSSWRLLVSLFNRTIQINPIFNEKLVNLLLDICHKLLATQKHLQVDEQFVDLSQLVDTSTQSDLFIKCLRLDELESTTRRSIFHYLLICLEIYLRHNDGVTNSPLQATSSSQITVLGQLIFNQPHCLVKYVYLRFLAKLFKLNFVNLSKRAISTNNTSRINNLFIKHFHLIQNSFNDHDDQENKLYFLKLCINYIHDYAIYSNFVNSSGMAATSVFFNQTPQANLAFENLLNLLNTTGEFLINNLVSGYNNDIYWKKLTDVLVEMRSFKNSYEHSQTCLRSKHATTPACRQHLLELDSKHNDLTNDSSSGKCIFAKLNLTIMTTLSQADTRTRQDWIKLLSKFGLCTCLDLDTLLNNTTHSTNDTTYYLIYFDFVLSVYKTEIDIDSKTGESVRLGLEKRKSIFPAANTELSDLNDHSEPVCQRIGKILAQMDSLNSVHMARVLNSGLKRYKNFIRYNECIFNALMSCPKRSQVNTEPMSSKQTLAFKQLVYEIVYLYNKALEEMKESDSEKSETRVQLFHLACEFFNELFLLSNSQHVEPNLAISHVDLEPELAGEDIKSTGSLMRSSSDNFKRNMKLADTRRQNSAVVSSSKGESSATAQRDWIQVESVADKRFFEFMSENSIRLYEVISELASVKLDLGEYLPILINSQLILFRHQQAVRFSSTNNIESELSKCLVERISSKINLLDNELIIGILLELYIKCGTFRHLLDQCVNFDSNLLKLLTNVFDELDQNAANDVKKYAYLEILLDLVFVFFYFHRRKNLNDIYQLLRTQLNKNTQLLLTYLNFMTLSKAFKFDKLIQTSSKSNQAVEETKRNSVRVLSSSGSSDDDQSRLYEGDGELTTTEILNESQASASAAAGSSKYDLILSSRVLEICLSFIIHVKRQQKIDLSVGENDKDKVIRISQKYDRFNLVVEQFFKKLLYLLQSCSLNVQILLNINKDIRQLFIDLLGQSIIKIDSDMDVDSWSEYLEKERTFLKHCFDVLYLICAQDMNETFLSHMLDLILNTANTNKHNIITREMCANLLVKLSKSLSLTSSSHYVRLPSQVYQEPIDFLLQTSPYEMVSLSSSTSRLRRSDSMGSESSPKERKSSGFFKPMLDYISPTTPTSPGKSKIKQSESMSAMHESIQKIYMLKIPIKQVVGSSSSLHQQQHQQAESTHHSYSFSFNIRFDDNLIKFAKSYGLGSNSQNKAATAFESYTHLFSINLNNELSTMEIWLNPNGNLLFIRRADQSIIITFNFVHIKSNEWHFVHISYNEEQFANKLNCRISYSINLSDIVDKEFEIFSDMDKSSRFSSIYNVNSAAQNLYLYLGHQEKRHQSNHSTNLLTYDLGQFIVSKDATNYTDEHLILLMHIMDTNLTHLHRLAEYDWSYLLSVVSNASQLNKNIQKSIDSLQKNHNELFDQIMAKTIVVFHPRNPLVYAIKSSAQSQRSFNYADLDFTCKAIQQTTLDVVLARCGGIQQLLVLLARLVEQENTNFNFAREENVYSSLAVLDTLVTLINKRPHLKLEFKKCDGYALLKRVFTSIASLNKFRDKQLYSNTIKNRLFVKLVNGCFQIPVFSVAGGYDIKQERVDMSFNLQATSSSSQLGKLGKKPNISFVYLINADLLSQTIVEWDMWKPWFARDHHSTSSTTPIWQNMFKILNKLLEDSNPAQSFHLRLFLRHGLIEKLMNFILDANTDNYLIDQESCHHLVRIFKHFNSIFNNVDSSKSVTKQLFANFSDYLYILHSERNVYIVNQKNEFYFHLNLNLSSNLPTSSSDASFGHQNSLVYGSASQEAKKTDTSSQLTTTSTLKGQIINFDRFDQNEANFSLISSGIMHIMQEMLAILPDPMVNDILSLLKFESFIMFAMDESQDKRLEAFKLFMEILERSSNFSYLANVIGSTVGNVMANVMTSTLPSIGSGTASGVNSQIMLTSSGSNAAGAMSTTGMLARSFEQQSWIANRENLIYAMSNQLAKYDQLDERFLIACVSKFINKPFDFRRLPDYQLLKSDASHILHRSSYFCLLVSLLYASRKNVDLCKSTLKLVSNLLEAEILRIDYLISRTGLLQVLINLLRYYSENLLNTDNKEHPVFTNLKSLFCLICRLLLKLTENQDPDLFSYFANSLINLCYNSNSNQEFQALNFNIKAIFLKIANSVVSDLNHIYSSTNQPSVRDNSGSSGNAKTTLFKKIITPLMTTSSNNKSTESETAARSSSTSGLFDSDMIFQKFVSFLVDFVFIVYDKISDCQLDDARFDINDEIAISAFTVLSECLAISLENNQRAKFTNLFRTNLNLIRYQFRRLLIFMMHPNHKLRNTRLKLIKILTTNPNCETILKCALTLPDNLANGSGGSSSQQLSPISSNSKLSFYLSSLMALAANNQKDLQIMMGNPSVQLSNNDKELLIEFNSVLTSAGVNFKTEYYSIINSYARTSSLASSSNNYEFNSADFSATESTYLIVNTDTYWERAIKDLRVQFFKELDKEILNIYFNSQSVLAYFLEQYDRLIGDLSQYAYHLTNKVVCTHSSVHKQLFQRIKSKLIQQYDVKQKWLCIIENMTHERCMWFDSESWPMFEILDQTESPTRERRRLKKSHLYIRERFFKEEVRDKLKNEKKSHPLKYLLSEYDDHFSSTSNDEENTSTNGPEAANEVASTETSFASHYMLNQWKYSENIRYSCTCKNVMPYCEIKGQLVLSEARINFAADEKNYKYLMGMESFSYSWSYDDIREIYFRRYLLKDVGLELFLVFGHTILLAFDDTKERIEVYRHILTSKKVKNLIKSESVDDATNLWKEGKLSNYEYLMQLNKYSGRTFNDLMQYPVYPHIVANYTSNVFDLAVKDNYRDLSRPIAVQHKEREEKFLQNYRMLSEAGNEAYHYASLYSNSGTVLHYLVRLPPFTKMFLDYQDQNFDVPDRTFHSMNTSWLLSSMESTTDYKELIPEFFFLHEFFTNRLGFNFGQRQNGQHIDNVELPPWSTNNPRLFVNIMRQALESNYVTLNLNNWIDLVFGYKQSGRAALEAINCYHPACYFGYPVDQIADPVDRKAIETMIKTWGQTPKQLFTNSHTPSLASLVNQLKKSSSLTLPPMNSSSSVITFQPASSIHNIVLNVKWGSYVGSLEQISPPVCVYKESFKKNIVSLVPVPNSNEIIGLSNYKCLLIERSKDMSTKTSNNESPVSKFLLEWCFNEDYIKSRVDTDNNKSPSVSSNLVPIRSNEQNIMCFNCIGSNYLVVGFHSGLLSVFKLRKEKESIHYDSFHCHLYGHKLEIADIYVCLSYSTMATCSKDGLLILWDTNKLTYVNSIELSSQSIYKVCISETTNEIAFIANSPNKLYFYTGNCDLIGQKALVSETDSPSGQSSTESYSNNISMKSLCFSNCVEGLNVNVIAVGLSNGKINLYSTWDLTLLREITIHFDSTTSIGCIICLTYSQDGKRLYAADTYARVYILEPFNSPAAQSKAQSQSLLSSSSISSLSVSNYLPNYTSNLACFT